MEPNKPNLTKIALVIYSILVLAWGLSGCTRHEVIKAYAEPALKPQQPLANSERLDVGIIVFDPGSSGNDTDTKGGVVSEEIRRAEARYIAAAVRTTLAETGYWRSVRVVPRMTNTADVIVRGEIVESNGLNLALRIKVSDATGRNWLDERYSGTASKYAYTRADADSADPFQSVFNAIANDMAEVRNRLDSASIQRIREVSELKYAAEFAPDVFESYLLRSETGDYTPKRLPAHDDPMIARIRLIRDHDHDFLDVLDRHYSRFADAIRIPYREWRKSSYDEAVALRKVERSARNQKVLGAAAVVVGLTGTVASDSSLGTAMGAASTVGGLATLRQGLAKSQETEMHREFMGELNASFAREVTPRVVEVEGRVMTLTGSVEAQYREWRSLLRAIYATQTGFMLPDKTQKPGEMSSREDVTPF